MMITTAIITVSQGIPPRFRPVFSCCTSMPYPPGIAVAVPPRPYDIPTPGAGLFFHDAMPEHWWEGGSRHSGQNAPPQCWQVNGSAHSFPQYSQRPMMHHCIFFALIPVIPAGTLLPAIKVMLPEYPPRESYGYAWLRFLPERLGRHDNKSVVIFDL